MNKNISIKEILEYLNCKNENYKFEGKRDIYINGFSSYANYKVGGITWIKSRKTMEQCSSVQNVTLAVVQDGVEAPIAESRIIVEESKRVFFDLLDHFFSTEKKQEPIGHNTYLSPEVKLGKNVVIGHNCTLDGDISIGDGTRIYNNVSIINCVKIGKNCEIQSGVKIGHDGFAFTEDQQFRKSMIKHYGGVTIEDNVFIGGNCHIARGTIDHTVIGEGSKIDASCSIAHNCRIGKNVAMIMGSRIYGSVDVGDNAYIASALIKNQAVVGKNAVVGMGSVVTKDVEDNTTVVGVPARIIR